MKSWRGVPVLVSVLSGLVVGCGPVPEGEVESGAVESARESEAVVGTVTAEGGLIPNGGWEVCDDVTQRVRDIHPTASSTPDALVEVNGRLVFIADDGQHGRELWVSLGQGRPTSLLKDVNPKGHATPRSLTVMGRWLFFVADDGDSGPELWRTDGTEGGTARVKDVAPGRMGAVPDQLTVVDGTLYFTANDGEHGRELWRTDGTEKGTELVRDFTPGMYSSDLDKLTAWESGLALVRYDPATWNTELWRLDKWGRMSRLFILGYGVFEELEPAGRQLFFTVDAGTGEADLWVTRDTPGTAKWLRHFPGQHPVSLTALEDAVYFVAGGEGDFGVPGDPVHGSELWTSDGTVWGTRMVRDIRFGPESAFAPGYVPQLVVLERTLYFAADDGFFGRELWRSDGTPWGTWLVRDLQPGQAGSDPDALTADTGWLFFSASTSGHGSEVWYSGGWPWDTRPLADIASGAASSDPRSFVRSGWDVFFAATDSAGDRELWSVPFRPTRYCGDRAR
ncbi:ELWxxDGT repeat protein [Pyxidicoccus trucidator]|uniref:ELWxxDGT repeat protein n=1 Tax=Pyxidicoccus trucidator TaxID=2709662 RepID=UPI0013DC3883|nr:ELWxxDGT repeat protein [Pyxidicoccus trucidator]